MERVRDLHYADAALFFWTAVAAFRITSSTKSGWDNIGTWLLSVSKVVAPIRFATKRSNSGWIVRSFVATMYQLGFDLHAVPSTLCVNKSATGATGRVLGRDDAANSCTNVSVGFLAPCGAGNQHDEDGTSRP